MHESRTTVLTAPAGFAAFAAGALLLAVLDHSGVQAVQTPAPGTPRSYDGTGNNVANPDWGAVNARLLRASRADYADDISEPAGSYRPSPRLISNTIADQSEDLISDRLLSAMIYAFGQFIDHDLDHTPRGTSEVIRIPIPAGDPQFDPGGSGSEEIRTFRSVFDPATGTAVGNPREQANVVSAFLDGSAVYGSDEATAGALRTRSGGQLKTGPDATLPLNNAANFPEGTLPMENDARIVPDDRLFAAGDVRANENVELTALHTLFVREHNAIASRLAGSDPALSDEQLYQLARSEVIAEIQAITFREWLPAMLGKGAVPPYRGYRERVNPGIDNVFSAAAFRLGHTLLGDDVEFLDDDGNEVAEEMPLSSAFFNPASIIELGIDPILKYLVSDPASELDTQVVNSVRNFLFGEPGAGGLDLASLNIARGRDHGLADYNAIRQAYGLPRARSFADITSDETVQADLGALYDSVDDIDAWVGLLAEGHVPRASVGPTLRAILLDQFTRLRDGDRFWLETAFRGDDLTRLAGTRLVDVIRRNTGLTNLQPDAFFFQAGIAGTVYTDSNGDGEHDRGERPLAGAAIRLVSGGEALADARTSERGRYTFDVLDGLRTGTYVVQVVNEEGTVIAASETIAVTNGAEPEDRYNIAVPPR
jgi:hypothetical protein